MSFISNILLVFLTFIIASIFYDSVTTVVVLHVIAGLTIIFSSAIDVENYEKERKILEEKPKRENRFLIG